ncbi:MAG: hypothetical protein WCI05_03180 [Myxococcales bacterium]
MRVDGLNRILESLFLRVDGLNRILEDRLESAGRREGTLECPTQASRFAAGVETSSSYYCSRIDCDALNLNPGQCLYKGIETNSIDAYCSVVATP